MKTLAIDIETYSSNDIKRGIHNYVSATDFEILMLSFSVDESEPVVIDLKRGDVVPSIILAALVDPGVLKTAYNAAFELLCIAKGLSLKLDPSQWECTMVKAAMLGLPFGLAKCAEALNLPSGKDAIGDKCIKYFSVPCKPSKANGMRTRNLPEHNSELWERFLSYNKQDVVVELAIRDKIKFFEISDFEKRVWELDQKINNLGVKVDRRLVNNAIYAGAYFKNKYLQEANELTGLDNANSQDKLSKWLTEELGENINSVAKEVVTVMLKKYDNETVRKVLLLKQKLSKSSISKYVTMQKCMLDNDRLYDTLQFYGANRTGRFAGRLVQLQNLPRNDLKSIDAARTLLYKGDLETLDLFYDSVPDVLSQLVRTAFIPSNQSGKLVSCDFSAIEALVLAALAGEEWRMEVFRTHGKIYEASAAAMFGIDINLIREGFPEYAYRAKGKVSELACGYGGSIGALLTMGALKGLGVKDQGVIDAVNFLCEGGNVDLNLVKIGKLIDAGKMFGVTKYSVHEALKVISVLKGLISSWREANPAIVKYWYDVNRCAINAVKGEPGTVGLGNWKIRFFRKNGALNIQLPSGRCLVYPGCNLTTNRFGNTSVSFKASVKGKWVTETTYGGKLTENITQAVARDLLCYAMLNLDAEGYDILMHIHDEVVVDSDDAAGIETIMKRTPDWAGSLPLRAVASTLKYFKKD